MIGDTARLLVERAGEKRTIEVKLGTFDTPSVSIVDVERPSPKQFTLRNAWINGT